MKKIKRVNLMLVWLFLTTLLLTMTTYAWFSANRIFEIDSFDIHVASKGGLEISTDGINWKGVIGLIDLIDANNTYLNNLNQIPNTAQPVSSGGELENGLLKLYYGQVSEGIDNEFYLYANRSVETSGFGENSNGEFVTFDVFLKTTAKKNISISPSSKIEYLSGEGNGIENAFRVAFLNQGTMPSNSTINQIQNLRNSTKAYIWETNYDTHTAFGVNHAKDIYNIDTQENDAQPLEYYGITNDVPKSLNANVKNANEETFPNYFKKVKVDVITKKDENELKKLFEIEEGITKVRLYIWVEGQDVDCENNASVANLSINIQFTTE